MELTRITKDNLEFFRPFFPQGQATPDQAGVGLIDDKGMPCAAAVLSGMDGEAALDWIYVHPDHRRRGVGSELLQKIEELLKKETDAFSASYPANLAGMDDFLMANGFFLTEGNIVCTVPLAELQALPEVKKLKKMAEKDDIRTLASLNKTERTAFLGFLGAQFEQEGPVFRCDPELSFAAFDGGHVSGALLIERQDEVQILYVSALAGKGRTGAISVLGHALTKLEQEPELKDYLIQFLSENKKIDNLIDTIGDLVESMDVGYIRYAIKAI